MKTCFFLNKKKQKKEVPAATDYDSDARTQSRILGKNKVTPNINGEMKKAERKEPEQVNPKGLP